LSGHRSKLNFRSRIGRVEVDLAALRNAEVADLAAPAEELDENGVFQRVPEVGEGSIIDLQLPQHDIVLD